MVCRVRASVEPTVGALNQSMAHSGSTPDYNLLNPEHFLQVAHSMRTRQSREPGRSQPAASDVNIILRFTGNLLSSFYSSREANDQSSHPGLLEFLSVLENAYDRELSEGLVSVTPLAIMWGHTANILMWSQVIRSNGGTISRRRRPDSLCRTSFHIHPDTLKSVVGARYATP